MRVCIVILFSLTFLTSISAQQDPWLDKQWITIGSDSTRLTTGNVIVTGQVKVKGSGEAISGASISADGFKYFNYSDTKGKYILELPPGKYKITVRHIGMKAGFYRWIVVSGGVLNVELEEGITDLEELVVTARPIDSNIKQSLAGVATLGINEIKTLPVLMGEVDIVKSLQLMPGVSSIGEAAQGFNVRGGRPDQNLTLFNDAPIFNTSHALGFVSTFNQDIVRDFSLYKGSVPAQFGGRASSILEINANRGNFEKWNFQGGVGPISSRVTIDGPIKKSKTSILLSGRAAYPNWILRRVSDPNVNSSSASFYDVYLSLSHRFNSNSSIESNFYQSNDGFLFSNQFGYDWKSSLAQIRWTGFADRKASPNIGVTYGEFKTNLIDPVGQTASQLTNVLRYVQVKPVINYIPNEKHSFSVGFETMIYLPKDEVSKAYGNISSIIPKRINKESGLENSIFANHDFEISERISLTTGLRFSSYVQLGPDSVFQYMDGVPKSTASITDTAYYKNLKKIASYNGLEPRVALRFSTFKNQSLKISYNRMRQYIHQISNTASPTPVDLWQVSTSHLPPQVADNFSAGYFWNLKNNTWETSIEVYYKNLKSLIEYKDFPELYVNNHLETELLTGNGQASGIEFLIRKIKGSLTGWISYTYSQTRIKVNSIESSEAINNGDWFAANYNKPHLFNFVLNKRMYNKSAFSATLSYASGRPFTAIESSYIADGVVVPVYSLRNQYTIPAYIRLDLSLTIGNVVRKLDDSLSISIYNLFGRDNAYSVFYQRPSSQFFIPKPFQLSILGAALPSLTYNLKF